MKRVLFAESAVFHGFHTLRMILLILSHVIVAALALSAGKSNLCTHINCPPYSF